MRADRGGFSALAPGVFHHRPKRDVTGDFGQRAQIG